MARVCVEERCFGEARLNQLARAMGWDVRTALGALVFLWHDSQQMKKAHASAEELAIWSRVDENQAVAFSNALLAAGYVTKSRGNKLTIKGNAEHIEALASYRKRGQVGGKATREKHKSEKQKETQAVSRRASGPASAGQSGELAGPSSLLFSSSLFSSKHNKEDPLRGEPPALQKTAVAKSGKSVDVPFLIGVYVKAWQTCHGVRGRPDLSGKSLGILKRMAEHRGKEELSELLQVYCQMKNDWYFKKKHDLVTFEANLNDIVVARHKGFEVGKEKSWMDLEREREKKEKESGNDAVSPASGATTLAVEK